MNCPTVLVLQERDAKALADKVAAKKAREEAIARGEIVPDEKPKGKPPSGGKK